MIVVGMNYTSNVIPVCYTNSLLTIWVT